MRRYKEYKDSGVKWIGEIPSHWKIGTLREFLKIFSDKNHPSEQLLSVVREEGVIIRNKDSKEENHNFIPDDLSGYKKIKVGDFVINKMKAWQGSYGVSRHQGIVSPAYYTCELRFENKEFFNYAIRSFSYVPFFTQYSKGIRVGQWDLSPIGLKSIPFILPPLAEQSEIVNFLDKKLYKIDTLVSKTEKQIELLKEWEQAEIARVVTKGLDPNVKMKDSGISWIGMIPEHWDVKMLSQMAKEHYISNKNVHHQNLLSLSYGRVINKDINTTDGLLPTSFDGYQIVENGNIVLRLTDLQNDHKSFRVGLATQEGIITSAYLALKAMNHVSPEYLYYLLHFTDIKKVFYSMGNGLRQNLNWGELRKLGTILPPKEEQQYIVKYISAKLSKIDSYTTHLQTKIDYLKEYRQRLISDVVTGKINVQPV